MADVAGNYRGFFIHPVTRETTRSLDVKKTLLEELAAIEQKNAIRARDEKIALWLNRNNIGFLLDVGCDFSSLLNEANKLGIASLGLDIDSISLALVRSAKLNASRISIEDIVAAGKLLLFPPSEGKQLRAVSCLNILHSGDLDTKIRTDFLNICLNDADFVIVTLTKKILNQLKSEVHFEVFGFVGGGKRPISDTKAQLLQYGTTFKFKGKLHILEHFFWKKIRGSYDFPLPSRSYDKLVVILAKPKIG